jgi:hypothetical protein
MKRYLCWLALGLVIAAPAAAAACGRLWGRPFFAPRAYYGPPVYAPPPMMAGPVVSGPMAAGPLVCPPPAYQYAVPPPAVGHTLPAPWIEPAPRHATPSPAPAPSTGAAIPSPMSPTAAPARAPAVEPLVPTAGSDAPPKGGTSGDVTMPAAAAEPMREPMPDFPAIEIPKDLRTNPAPKPPAPKEPDMRDVPKVPAVGAPKETVIPAIPSPAPAPEALIPPPSLPIVPDAGKREALPSLTLPPEVPVAPEKKGDSTSRSSPLAGGAARDLTVNVFPVKGEALIGTGYRTVGFFNHTARDLALTIEGRAVKLPARSYLHAQLAATFTWGHGDRPSARETVPDGAGGVDVVFRD